MLNRVPKTSKAQPAIEYLSTFSVALLLLAIILAIVGLTLLGNNKVQTTVPSSCYISAQLNCFQMAVSSNGVVSTAIIVFTNNLGTEIQFPTSNAVAIVPEGSQKSYAGECYPTNAVAGATVICSATLAGYNPSVGTQLNPTFQLTYSQCASGACGSYVTPNNLNTSGSGTTYVSSNALIYPITLDTFPSGGKVSVNGVDYPSGSVVDFVAGQTYSIDAIAPGGYSAFAGWETTGGASVGNYMLEQTTAAAGAQGAITADFICYTLSMSASPSSTGTQTANPTSNGNCAQGSYLPGTQVQITADPAFNYWFNDWSGSGSISYSGSSDPATVTMSSDIVETANYHECYLLTVNYVGSGSVSRSLSNSAGCATDYYMPNTQVQVYASPSPSWVLGQVTNDWTGSGGPTDYTGSASSPTVTMNGDITETANFNPQVTIEISPSSASNGWQFCAGLGGNDGCTSDGVSSDTFAEPYGSTLNYVCTAPNYGGSGYSFMSFSGGYSSGSQCNSNAGVSMTAPTTIVANLGYSITVYNNGGPSGSIACVAAAGYSQVCASPGGSATLVASPGTDFNYANVNEGATGSYSWLGWSGTYSGGSNCLIGSGCEYGGFTLTGAVSETASWNILTCSGINDYYNPISAGGYDAFYVYLSGGSGNYCQNSNYAYGEDWYFPCADGATYCPGQPGYSCSGNELQIGANGYGVQFNNAGTFSGSSIFTDSGGGTCSALGSVTVSGSPPPPPPANYYCGNYGNAGSASTQCNGVYYDYCSGLGQSYIYEGSAIDDCGSDVALCHLCGATDAYGNVEGYTGDANGDNEPAECGPWAC